MQFCETCDNLLKAKKVEKSIIAYCDSCGLQREAKTNENYVISFTSENDVSKIEIIHKKQVSTVSNRKCIHCQTESLIFQELQPDRFNDEQSETIVHCINCGSSYREGRG